jgi:hypothetical protein
MPLFLGLFFIGQQPLVYGLIEWPENRETLRLSWGITFMFPLQCLSDGVAGMTGIPGDLIDTVPIYPAGRSDMFILIHPKHPFTSLLMGFANHIQERSLGVVNFP